MINFLPALPLGALVWIAPVLAFIASNIQWFNRRNVWGAICFSLMLGILCGLAFQHLPQGLTAALAGLISCILSERLVNLFFPKILGKIAFSTAIALSFYGLAYFFGIWTLCALLGVYCLFSLRDLWKNRARPKQPVPLAPVPGAKPIVVSPENNIKELERKPNIYILFLESIHSARALRLLYEHDDAGLADFLNDRQFRVYSHSCSNEYGTTLSLNTLLNMDSAQCAPLPEAPAAFQWLHGNGYRINLLDCAIYTFGHYVPYSDSFNFVIPAWVSFLYKWLLPFFLQSQALNAITKGIDPFADYSDYRKVRADLERLIARNFAAPACQIIRFGAIHVPGPYTFRERQQWLPRYLSMYEKCVPNIRDMVDFIISRDPDACIVAMGDHGAASWQGAWLGPKDSNANMRDHGVEPEVVAQDLTGTLLAIRLPGADLPDEQLTPANIFRLLFQNCSANGNSKLVHSPNNSYLHEPANPYPFLIARDCAGLENWIVQTPQRVLAEKLGGGEDLTIQSEKQLLDVASALENSGRFHAAADLLAGAATRGMASMPVVRQLANLYLRLGKAKEAIALLEPMLNENPDFAVQFSSALAMLGSISHAVNILNAMAQNAHLSPEELQMHVAYLYLLDVNPGAADEIYEQRFASEIHLAERITACSPHAYCLDAAGKTDAALDALDSLSLRSGHAPKYMGDIFTRAAAFCMRLGEFAQMPERMQRVFEYNREPYPVTIFLWQAGYLERLGRNAEALAALQKAYAARTPAPYLDAQIGLFLIRNRNNDHELRPFKKAGYEYLRTQASLISGIFDANWFANRYRIAIDASGMAPLTYFLHYGRLLVLDPCREFNSAYYCLSNRDLLFAGYDPFWHFTVCSPYENRNPSLLFNLQSYMARHVGPDWGEADPLIHYLATQKTQVLK